MKNQDKRPIEETVAHNCGAVMKYLEKNGADMYAFKKPQNKRLVEAAAEGNLAACRAALEAGANIHAGNDAAFRLAVERNRLKVVKYLVKQGADIHVRGDIAIRTASSCGYIAMVRYLIKQGANIHACDDAALCFASKYGHCDVVKLLIKSGADVHANDDYPLRSAASCDFFRRTETGEDYFKIVKCLVKNGADIHSDDNVAFRIAEENGYTKVANYLQKHM